MVYHRSIIECSRTKSCALKHLPFAITSTPLVSEGRSDKKAQCEALTMAL
jgi:hypothetical protein